MVCCSATSSDKQVALRTGFIHTFVKKEVVIKVWDPAAEGCTCIMNDLIEICKLIFIGSAVLYNYGL